MWRTVAKLSLMALTLAALAGCGGGGAGVTDYPGMQLPPDTRSQVTISQGMWGNVWFWEGDFMPRPESEPFHGTVTPVVREVLVYEPTNVSSCTGGGGFFSAVSAKLVATAISNASGFFQVSLPPGTYSVFIKEGQLYYAYRFSGDGLVQPVSVSGGRTSKIQLDIKYKGPQ